MAEAQRAMRLFSSRKTARKADPAESGDIQEWKSA
jgi:hypothetical protein